MQAPHLQMSARVASLVTVAVAAVAFTACGGYGKSQQHLRSAMDAKKPTLDSCYETALKRDATISGSVTMWLHVKKSDGAVSKMDVHPTGRRLTRLAAQPPS